jgi:type IV pilus assembly protein PilC
MTLYQYQAKDKEGKIYERHLDVANRLDIYNIIREEGGSVISITEAHSLKMWAMLANMFGKIKTHQKIIFAKNLGMMIKAGLPMTRALAVMSKQSTSKSFKKVLLDLEINVSHGITLSESLGKWPETFSHLFVSMVKAGEESGNVANSLEIVSSQMEKSYLLAKKVRGALIYPAVIITVMIVIAMLMLIYMVPTLTATFEGLGVKLPLATRVLIYLSNFMVVHTLAVLLVVVFVVISTILFFRTKVGQDLVCSHYSYTSFTTG